MKRMGRKRKRPTEKPMPAAAASERTRDRHKPGSRKTIAFPPELYALLQQLADKNRRPLNWEARVMAEKHLRDAGLMPPDQADPEE
jgi:hypothetical protein